MLLIVETMACPVSADPLSTSDGETSSGNFAKDAIAVTYSLLHKFSYQSSLKGNSSGLVPKNNFKTTFGMSVRGWRTRLGLSQEQLAERADLHRTYISDVERGSRNISLENIERLAQALAVSVSALFPQSSYGSEQFSASASGTDAGNLVEVLLVEDNPDDVELTLHAFKKARFANHVHVVNDGAEALDYVFCRGEYAERNPGQRPQVVLLDLDLPKVSGLEVLSRIKADKRTRMIPVLILTVSDDQYNIAECRRLGADNYIVKPVNFLRLSQATPGLNFQWALFKPQAGNSERATEASELPVG